MKGRIFLVLACALYLTACASGSVQEDPGVQDIQPGEQSVIQPPSHQAPESQVREKNI